MEGSAHVSELHPHEPDVLPIYDESGRCIVCAASIAAREIARQEIASLGGLVLRRLQEDAESGADGSDGIVNLRLLERIFGEVLNDFGNSKSEPGR